MKKLSLMLFLLILSCSFGTVSVEAHPKADEHYEELEAMLFDTRNYNGSDKIEILESASTLCIDQFGESNKDLLRDLEREGVPGLPSSVSKINPSNKNLSPTNHRTYTHQGWDYLYSQEKEGDLAHWPTRKNILLAATEDVFDFQTFSGKWFFVDFGYSEKCNSFSALIYYNHLLGDYLEDTHPTKGNVKKFNGISNGHTIPFASNSSNPVDIFSEIEKHLAKLFKDQANNSRVYDSLISDIQTLASEARKISGNAEGTITEDDFDDIGACVQELMNILTGENGKYNAIHELLMNEEFFTEVFY